MGNESKKYDLQEIFNWSVDDTVTPPLLQVGMKRWNGAGWVKDGGDGVGTSGGKSLSDASQGVVLESDQACDYVDITCMGGVLSIGASAGSTVATPGSEQGVILTPGSTVYRVYCSNLNQVYVSGASGTRVGYIYH